MLSLAAGAAWWVSEPTRGPDGRLSTAARAFFVAVGGAVLGSSLPAAADARAAALQDWLVRLEATIAGMPPGVQAEVDQLISLLTLAPGRLALTGLADDWTAASPAQLHAALTGMQQSGMALRQQVFHALRDLTNAAYFSGPETWASMGYPGPLKV